MPIMLATPLCNGYDIIEIVQTLTSLLQTLVQQLRRAPPTPVWGTAYYGSTILSWGFCVW